MKQPTYHEGIAGIGYYDGLPDGWRLATEQDFYFNGQLLVGVSYLLENSTATQYEGHRTKERSIQDIIQEILTFVNLQRVYVLEH